MMETTIDREATISEILALADAVSPQYRIVDAVRYQCRKTGKRYSCFGMPAGANREDFDRVTIGVVLADVDTGITYGEIAPDRETMERRRADARAARMAREREGFFEMTDEQLAESLTYWRESREKFRRLKGR